MILEGAVATLALLAVIAGFHKQEDLVALLAAHGPISAFSQGFQVITEPFFGTFGGILAVTILNSFILSTLDTCTRIERYITHELFGLKNRYGATLLIIILSALLVLSGQWEHIWPIFGAANQLVAALAFLVISTWLMTLNKPVRYTLVPAVLILVTTVAALLYQGVTFFFDRNYLLLGISAVLIVLAALVFWEGAMVLKNRRARM
jgi:carbon starvation protein